MKDDSVEPYFVQPVLKTPLKIKKFEISKITSSSDIPSISQKQSWKFWSSKTLSHKVKTNLAKNNQKISLKELEHLIKINFHF